MKKAPKDQGKERASMCYGFFSPHTPLISHCQSAVHLRVGPSWPVQIKKGPSLNRKKHLSFRAIFFESTVPARPLAHLASCLFGGSLAPLTGAGSGPSRSLIKLWG